MRKTTLRREEKSVSVLAFFISQILQISGEMETNGASELLDSGVLHTRDAQSRLNGRLEVALSNA